MKGQPFWYVMLIIAIAALSFSGCNQQQGSGPQPQPQPQPQPSFTLAVSPAQLDLLQWDTAKVNLTVTPKNGFTGTVELSLEGAPAGVSISPTQVQVSGSDPVTAVVTFSAAEDAAAGSAAVRLHGAAGQLSAEVQISLNVRALAKDWSLQSLPLRGVAGDGSGKLVAVSGGGWVLVSNDSGQHWQRYSVGEPETQLNAVTYGGGRFVAVGMSKKVFVSTDGENWTGYYLDSGSSPNTYQLLGIAYGGGYFVAAGAGGYFVSEDNGQTWTKYQVSGKYFYDVAFGDGKFTMVGEDDNINQGELLTVATDDFGNQSLANNTGEDAVVQTVIYDGSRFVALTYNKVYTSNDGGQNWSSENANGYFLPQPHLAYGSGEYVAVGCCGYTKTSTNLTSWSSTNRLQLIDDPVVHAASFTDVFYDAGAGFVAVGDGDQIALSSDGSSWSFAVTGTASNVTGLVYNGSGFISGDGNDGQEFSYDGGADSSWQPLSEAPGAVHGLGYDGSKYVALLYNDLATSDDGVHWDTLSPALGFTGKGVTAAGGKIVVVGESGNVAYSSDHGDSWDTATAGDGTHDLYGVAYGNGKYVAVGRGGAIFTSSDASGWDEVTNSPTTSDLKSVAYGHGRFVAVGEASSAVVLVSEDGQQWRQLDNLPSLSGVYLEAVTYGERGFVVVGSWYDPNSPSSLSGVLYSADGLHWKAVALPANETLSAVACGGGVCVAGGTNGLMVVAR